MNARDLIDTSRLAFVADATIAPTRSVTYTRHADSVTVVLNSFVGVGFFTKAERDALGRYEAFGGLLLSVPPAVNDTVTYDGNDWKVVRYSKLGQLYTVYAENKRHNGRPTI